MLSNGGRHVEMVISFFFWTLRCWGLQGDILVDVYSLASVQAVKAAISEAATPAGFVHFNAGQHTLGNTAAQ